MHRKIRRLGAAAFAAFVFALLPGVAAAACPQRTDAPRPRLTRQDLDLAVVRCANENGQAPEDQVMAACNGLVTFACMPSNGGPLFSVDDLEVLTWAYKLRANAHTVYGRIDEAIADLNDADAVQPRDVSVLLSRCRVRAAARRELDLALADCNAVLDLRPALAFGLDSRGLVHLQRGEYDAAIADYEAAFATTPELTSSLYGRGLARARLGQAEQGQADIAAATAADAGVAAEFQSFGLTP